MHTGRFLILLLSSVSLGLAACGDDEPTETECPAGQIFSSSEGRCVPRDPPVTDADGDGVAAADDCDDNDASLGATADDADCDGVLTAEDCDDSDDTVGSNADDMDCDGVAVADDCDDMDASLGAISADADCDGVLTADDCDDADDTVGSSAMDMDCDGVPTAMDCDDMDDTIGSNAMDMDCDGVPTAMDCDDMDDAVGSNAMDMDCDGVATADDCNDMDASLGATAADADCDGVLTAADCDDNDAALGAIAEDADCDGVPTAIDCDDNDAGIGSNAGDMDCDGVATADDCDDMDDSLGAIADDTDCDGALNGVDECPNDPEYQVTPPPVVNVAFPGLVSATNGTSITVRGTAIAVCETTVTAVSADINGTAQSLTITPGAEADWSFSTSLTADAMNTFVVTATSSATLDASATVMLRQHPAAAPAFGGAFGLDVDSATNTAYVVDNALPGIFSIDLTTGATNEFSGPNSGSGPVEADFSDPQGGIVVDSANNRLLVTDNGLDAIVAVSLTDGARSIFSDNSTDADGPDIGVPYGITVANGVAYYVDSTAAVDGVVAVNLTDGERTSFSDDNAPGVAQPIDFGTPRDIAYDATNNRLLVVDSGSSGPDGDALIAVSLADGSRAEVAQTTTALSLGTPRGVAVSGNTAYIADTGSGVDAIIAVDLTAGGTFGDRTVLSDAVTGTGEPTFNNARGVYVDTNRLLVTDSDFGQLIAVSTEVATLGNRVFIEPATPAPPLVGTGPTISLPIGVVFNEGEIYVADQGGSVFSLDPTSGERSVLNDTSLTNPQGLGIDVAGGQLLVPDNGEDSVVGIDFSTGVGTVITDDDSLDDSITETSSILGSPRGSPVVLPGGTDALVCDPSGGRDAIYQFNLTTGERTLFARTDGDAELFSGIQSLAIDPDGGRLFVTAGSGSASSSSPDVLVEVNIATKALTVLASETVGTGPVLGNPRGVQYDPVNDTVLVIDSDLDALVEVQLNADPSTNARTVIADATTGNGDHLTSLANDFSFIALDSENRVVYAVIEGTGTVMLIDLTTGDQVVIAR